MIISDIYIDIMSDDTDVHPQYAETVAQLEAVNEKLTQLQIQQSCDEACQRERIATGLKEQWLQAEVEADNVQEYHKEYIVYTEGEAAYAKMQLAKAKEEKYSIMAPLIAQVQVLINGFQNNLKILESIQSIDQDTTKSLTNYTNINKKLNTAQNKKLDAENTFDRLAYFESKGSKYLDTLKFLLYYAFWLVSIVFIFNESRTFYSESKNAGGMANMITTPNGLKFVLSLIIIILFQMYPFMFTAQVYYLVEKLGSLIGKIFGVLVLPFPQTKTVDNPFT